MNLVAGMRIGSAVLTCLLGILLSTGIGWTDDRPGLAKAVFAGGCFWCMEEVFENVDGVVSVMSGYMGGTLANPSYEQVSAGGTGHAESVEVLYDPAKVTYAQLLDTYWHNIDPFDANGQFCDQGNAYRSVIFYGNDEEKALADETKQQITDRLKEKVVTEVKPATTFTAAEDYHQNYHNTNRVSYKFYKWNCGRAQRLEQIWGPKPS